PFSLPERNQAYTNLLWDSLDGLKIAYSPDLGICRVDSEIQAVVAEAVEAFESAGATVDRADPDFEQDWETLHDAIEVLLQERYAGMYDTFKAELDIDLLERREEVTEEVISRIEKSQTLTATDVRRAERVRTAGYDAVQSLLADYDLLVTPTLAMAPFPKDTKPESIEGEPIDPLHGWILTWPFNLTGNPIAAVPAGFDDGGLPVGIQIVGPRGKDDRVVAAAGAYERVNPWQEAYPPS
ncbi:MAG: amidase family protein, partial [Halobacteriales archaeon]|nr:amidase family protein [Halobacteriales archaeon]